LRVFEKEWSREPKPTVNQYQSPQAATAIAIFSSQLWPPETVLKHAQSLNLMHVKDSRNTTDTI
jgi:hypothetical protein